MKTNGLKPNLKGPIVSLKIYMGTLEEEMGPKKFKAFLKTYTKMMQQLSEERQ